MYKHLIIPMLFGITPQGTEILAISILVAIFSSVVSYFILDREKMKKYKEETKKVQEDLKIAQKKGDLKKIQSLQGKMMSLAMEQMKMSLKPAAVTFIPFMLIYSGLYIAYGVGEINYLGFALTGHSGENVFAWNDLQKNDSKRLVEFLENDIKIDWQGNTSIDEMDNGTINVSSGSRSVMLTLEKEKKKVAIMLGENDVREYAVREENGNQNVYAERNVAVIFDLGLTWLWWYIITIFLSSMILNKILRIY